MTYPSGRSSLVARSSGKAPFHSVGRGIGRKNSSPSAKQYTAVFKLLNGCCIHFIHSNCSSDSGRDCAPAPQATACSTPAASYFALLDWKPEAVHLTCASITVQLCCCHERFIAPVPGSSVCVKWAYASNARMPSPWILWCNPNVIEGLARSVSFEGDGLHVQSMLHDQLFSRTNA